MDDENVGYWEEDVTWEDDIPPKHPIHEAAAKGDVAALTALLTANLDVLNLRDTEGRTPLHKAIRANQPNAVQVLLSAGADPSVKEWPEPICITGSEGDAITLAAVCGAIQTLVVLLEHGVDVPGTLLAAAAAIGRLDSMQTILQNLGSRPFSDMPISKAAGMALTRPALCWHDQAVHFLLHDVPGFPDLSRADDQSVLDEAMIQALEDYCCVDFCRDWADPVRRLNIVKELVAAGANVNARRKDEAIDLLQLALGYHLINGTPCIATDVAALLIENGANVVVDESWNPIFPAAGDHRDDDTLVRKLSSIGLGCNVTDESGDTPLHLVSQPSIAAALLDCGADLHARNARDQAPLHSACEKVAIKVAMVLLTKGAVVDDPIKEDRWTPLLFAAGGAKSLELCQLLVAHGANITARAKDGLTPLHRAVSSAELELAKYFLDQGADINAALEHGQSVLHSACHLAMEDAKTILTRQIPGGLEAYDNGNYKAILQTLLERGANLEAKDDHGRTPLFYTLERHPMRTTWWRPSEWAGHINLYNLIAQRGANVSARDNDGKTALEVADTQDIEVGQDGLLGLKPVAPPQYPQSRGRGGWRGGRGRCDRGRGDRGRRTV